MDEQPRSRPFFPGDDFHELRDAQTAASPQLMALIAGRMCDYYLRASVIMDLQHDPLAIALRREKRFDWRTVMLAHAHLAAHWRLIHGHVNPSLPGVLDHRELLEAWRRWATHEALMWWLDHPILVRKFVIVLSRWHGPETLDAEADLWFALKEIYPVPPAEHRDFFDDPAAYAAHHRGAPKAPQR